MRLLLVALLGLFLAFPAQAAPFVVADVVTGVSQCGVVLDGGAKVLIPASGNECRFDVASVGNGVHSVTMTAIAVDDPVWGSQESAPSAPFDFTRPGQPATPGGLRLEP